MPAMRLRLPVICFLSLFLLTACITVPRIIQQTKQTTSGADGKSTTPALPTFVAPLEPFAERITKKTFGLKVSPGHSPVQPERFSGYHTGIDLETFPDEQTTDVPIVAACEGTLVLRRWVSGYGGVAVETCTINGASVTVIYGHLSFSSITATLSAPLAVGERIGVLGQGRSHETDGERKHLHFGIHRGRALELRGYVQNPAELAAWIDPAATMVQKMNPTPQ